MSAKFVQIPVEIISDPNITPLQMKLYCLLMRFGYEGRGWSQCGHALLARYCNAHPQSIAKSLKALQTLGYISVQRIGLNKPDKIFCLKTYKKDGRSDTKPNIKNKRKGIAPSISKNRSTTNRTMGHVDNLVQNGKTNTDIGSVDDPLKPSVALPIGHITTQIKPPTKEHQPLTNELKQRVANSVRPASYSYLFKDLIVVENGSDKLTISAQRDAFSTDFIKKNYEKVLKQLADKPIELI